VTRSTCSYDARTPSASSRSFAEMIPELASYLRIEERELEADRLNQRRNK